MAAIFLAFCKFWNYFASVSPIPGLVRENEVTTTRFFEADGVGLLCLCIRSKVDKLRMKSLFLLRSITHPLLQSKSESCL